MVTNLASFEMSAAEFARVSSLLYDLCRIKLVEGKEGLVKSRLGKRMRTLGLQRLNAYLDYVARDKTGREAKLLIDSLTTNKTSFFREPQHFDFMRRMLPSLVASKPSLRIWSAACSSGEEPYSIAILLREAFPRIDGMDVRILATDISTQILARANAAVYDRESLRDMPPAYVDTYFTCVAAGTRRLYQVNDAVKCMVRFARLNLMDPWPMKRLFDVVFCRNVMIYFDNPTREALVQRFWDVLEPGGHLFVGHSESLTNSSHKFRYVQPATYVKQVGVV